MTNADFWKLDRYSDRQLLAGLDRLVRSCRQGTAELVAHLGEVEARRLHLEVACSSMFDYCVQRLGLSEDEACRRIDVARLARRFPALFPRLASGELSLSVAALLKQYLAEDNQAELVATVAGKTVQRAREALAALFPRPDVASSVRKLPERRAVPPPSAAPAAEMPMPPVPFREAPGTTSARSPAGVMTSQLPARTPRVTAAPALNGVMASVSLGETPGVTVQPALGLQTAPQTSAASELFVVDAARPNVAPAPLPLAGSAGLPAAASAAAAPLQLSAPARMAAPLFEALSLARYRVQFTASASLKEKLELARDLSRHRSPSGDFAGIMERALDLLLAQLMKERFGATSRPRRSGNATTEPELDASVPPDASTEPELNGSTRPSAGMPPEATTDPELDATTDPEVNAASRRVSNATRRAVLERDGLQCNWVDGCGRRCSSRAWLELDHRRPRAKGGGAEPGNIRLLCRAHNRHAAEREYGRDHIDAAIAERRRAEREDGRDSTQTNDVERRHVAGSSAGSLAGMSVQPSAAQPPVPGCGAS